MKRIIFTLLAAMLMANIAMASAVLVKERAKSVRDQNNQQQGVATPPPNNPSSGAPSGGGASSGAQGISSAQQSLIDRLNNDLTVIKVSTPATAVQKQHVQDDLASLSKGANKPSKTALAKLSQDLTTALVEKQLSSKDLGQLAKNINIVVNCGFLTADRAQTFVNESRIILKNAGVSDPTVQLIVKDLNIIIVEIQRKKPDIFQ